MPLGLHGGEGPGGKDEQGASCLTLRTGVVSEREDDKDGEESSEGLLLSVGSG